MASHFVSKALAEECIPESDITNTFIVEKLAGGHEQVKCCLEEGMKNRSVNKEIEFYPKKRPKNRSPVRTSLAPTAMPPKSTKTGWRLGPCRVCTPPPPRRLTHSPFFT